MLQLGVSGMSPMNGWLYHILTWPSKHTALILNMEPFTNLDISRHGRRQILHMVKSCSRQNSKTKNLCWNESAFSFISLSTLSSISNSNSPSSYSSSLSFSSSDGIHYIEQFWFSFVEIKDSSSTVLGLAGDDWAFGRDNLISSSLGSHWTALSHLLLASTLHCIPISLA